MTAALFEARGLVRRYATRGSAGRPVLDGIDLDVGPGETLGIIGGSGTGKSTLARILMGLDRPDAGTVRFRGIDIHRAARPARLAVRPQIQAVFQDPYGSLDPRWRVGAIVGEPLRTGWPGRAERRARVLRALDAVGLPAAAADRYPGEFSGGQRQRIAIARALITEPALVIADEPVSALDVSVQAQVLNLLLELRARMGLALVFISHDLAVIRHMAHRVAVLDGGHVVEQGEAAGLFARPRHPVTQRLIAAMPAPPDPSNSPGMPC